jgi:hypothetical protein
LQALVGTDREPQGKGGCDRASASPPVRVDRLLAIVVEVVVMMPLIVVIIAMIGRYAGKIRAVSRRVCSFVAALLRIGAQWSRSAGRENSRRRADRTAHRSGKAKLPSGPGRAYLNITAAAAIGTALRASNRSSARSSRASSTAPFMPQLIWRRSPARPGSGRLVPFLRCRSPRQSRKSRRQTFDAEGPTLSSLRT